MIDDITFREARQLAQNQFVGTDRIANQGQREALKVLLGNAQDFATSIYSLVPNGRDRSIALTALEDALMRANRGLFS